MSRAGRRTVATAVAVAIAFGSISGCTVPAGHGVGLGHGPSGGAHVEIESRQGWAEPARAGGAGAGLVPEGMSGLILIPVLGAAMMVVGVVTIAVLASKRRD